MTSLPPQSPLGNGGASGRTGILVFSKNLALDLAALDEDTCCLALFKRFDCLSLLDDADFDVDVDVDADDGIEGLSLTA